MKNVAIIVFTVSLFLVFTAGAALGTTTVPDFPDWWKNSGGSPDGVTRTQAHFFHSDPNNNPSPDWVYNGFQPAVQDSWNVNVIQQFDVDNIGGLSPFYDSDGLHHGDEWAKVGIVAEGGGTMSKLMGNLADPTMIKEFHAEIIWYGTTNCSDVTIDVQADGIVQSSGGVITDTTDNMWHLTYLDGTIDPQPDYETFNFNFATGGIAVDSVYIGTHCVPEPAALSLFALGGLALVRRRR